MKLSISWYLVAGATATTTAIPGSDDPLNIPLRHHAVTELPPGSWIENLAVRKNGNLLLTTVLPDASLFEVVDPAGASPTLIRHFTIEQITSLLGIAELTPDRFVVAGGNFSFVAGPAQGSFGLWSIDFNDPSPQPSLLADLPEARLLNGVIAAPEAQDVVLISDSFSNLVWRVNAATREVDIAANLQDATNPGPHSALGINGIKIHDGDLWWTNSTADTGAETNESQRAMYRIKVEKDGSPAPGAQPERMVQFQTPGLDDFVFGPGQNDLKWVATNSGDSIIAVNAEGRKAIVAGGDGSMDLTTTTACQFGRTQRDGRTLYVTTSGVEADGESRGIPSMVQAIDTTGFDF
ncbi:hypothetical protein ESCO_005279 [Escovopsis weberi]|uniref:SMP-30/Gluconolactonase/LRE-like region domain-containing protein n=1 Tax=Escovopsis weberi TaxID=150374 RepID=A0A0M8N4S9_ESCWE|nr:hypothetical protein ESCO_005279 [Escovopsis weberi]